MPNNKIQDYIFYKIVCLDNSCNELCYVGSTANWKARNYSHKYNCTNENAKQYNSKIYTTIRANGSWQNFKMIQIGTASQLTKREAEQIEEEYRKKEQANMNSIRCYLTDEDKREYNHEHSKKYREQNHDKILEHDRQRYPLRREAVLQNKKEYRQKNLEYFRDYDKNRRPNKELRQQYLREYNKEKITCECGCEFRRDSLLKHLKTDKHLKLMEVVQN